MNQAETSQSIFWFRVSRSFRAAPKFKKILLSAKRIVVAAEAEDRPLILLVK